MSSLLVTIILNALFVIIVELILWKLFQRKIAGLNFPHETDASFFRFFTMNMMRLCALLHAIALIVLPSFFLILLW